MDERVLRTTSELHSLQNAANDETKSSAGDKYNTDRAMLHLDREKYVRQLNEAKKLDQTLHMMNIGKRTEKVELGSLVETTMATYFLSIPAGKLIIDDEIFYAISPSSPIGQAILEKREGDTVLFNGKNFRIKNIS